MKRLYWQGNAYTLRICRHWSVFFGLVARFEIRSLEIEKNLPENAALHIENVFELVNSASSYFDSFYSFQSYSRSLCDQYCDYYVMRRPIEGGTFDESHSTHERIRSRIESFAKTSRGYVGPKSWDHVSQGIPVSNEVTAVAVREQQPPTASPATPQDVPKPADKWKVYVDDNFNYGDEDERYSLGEFDSYNAAVQACRQLVDTYLNKETDKTTADALYESFTSYGEDPWIKGTPPGRDTETFSAWAYARERCNELRPEKI